MGTVKHDGFREIYKPVSACLVNAHLAVRDNLLPGTTISKSAVEEFGTIFLERGHPQVKASTKMPHVRERQAADLFGGLAAGAGQCF